MGSGDEGYRRCVDCDAEEYDDEGPCCDLIECSDGELRCEDCFDEWERTAAEEE